MLRSGFLRVRRGSTASAVAVVLLCGAVPAHADGLRFHGTAAGAHAVGGHQQKELSLGAGVNGTLEYQLWSVLAFGLRAGGLWLSEGDAPSDPGLAPEGPASALGVGLSITSYPLASEAPVHSFSTAGLWLSAAGGAVSTGGHIRAAVDGYAGWDLWHPQPNLGVGPVVGLWHIIQPDDELRPDDANLVMLGVHVRYWPSPASKAAPTTQDRDRDGVLDPTDRCPDMPEDRDAFQDDDGCPDPDDDQDGIADSKDRCPRVPEDRDAFQDQDGCPDPDNDQDRILDAKDECADEPEDRDGFEDEDGCPDPDNDQDQISDSEDLCPSEPENLNGYADHDGCPDEDQVRVVGDKIVLDDRVHFRTNSAILRIASYPLLERLAKLIREHPEYAHISIEGHADDRGSPEFNQRISADRARAVLEFLVRHGVARERLSSKGFGSTRPLVDKRSPRAFFMNRRVEFVVTRELGTTAGGADPSPAPTKPSQPGTQPIPEASGPRGATGPPDGADAGADGKEVKP